MLQDALEFCIQRTRENLTRLASFPERTANGQWVCVDNGGWVGGHWAGLLWLAFARTREAAFEQAARSWAQRLASRQCDETTHDLGFLFYLSHVFGAEITGDASLKAPARVAAQTLARRFHERGQFIQAWGAVRANDAQRGRTIVDTLMNLRLLYWASAEMQDPQFARVASAHAYTAIRYQVRTDFSVAHVADYDPATGEFLKQDTHQGLSATSCWSRGQAWAVYGLGDCYHATRDPFFLTIARALAEFALQRLPPDLVPYWDYDSPLIPNDVRDSSAAAALAAGLLRLARLESSTALAERWRSAATQMLQSLWDGYSSRGTHEPSILIHGTRSKPHGLVDHGLIYGDYYFLEALDQLLPRSR